MKKLIPLFLLFACQTKQSQLPIDKVLDEKNLRAVLDNQARAWNTGDIEKFMQSYWKSDSVLFIGRKMVRGWDSTLIRYKKGYPNKAAMGNLRFEILQIDCLSAESYLVTGNYFLKREKENLSGIFTLIFKKKNGVWVIVYDHTS